MIEPVEVSDKIREGMVNSAFLATAELHRIAVDNPDKDEMLSNMAQGVVFYMGFLEVCSKNVGLPPDGMLISTILDVGHGLMRPAKAKLVDIILDAILGKKD